MWGVVARLRWLGWRYNSLLIIQGVIISLGVSLVVRAFLPTDDKPAAPAMADENGLSCQARVCIDFRRETSDAGRATGLLLDGAMVSFATLATRNLTTVLALILMVSPV